MYMMHLVITHLRYVSQIILGIGIFLAKFKQLPMERNPP